MTDLEKETWNIIYTYFRDNKNYLTRHHLDSYNDFIRDKIPAIITQANPLIVYHEYNEKFNSSTNVWYPCSSGSKIARRCFL